MCVDANAGSDPAEVVPCDATRPSQHWALQSSGHIQETGTSTCLDVYNFDGECLWLTPPECCRFELALHSDCAWPCGMCRPRCGNVWVQGTATVDVPLPWLLPVAVTRRQFYRTPFLTFVMVWTATGSERRQPSVDTGRRHARHVDDVVSCQHQVPVRGQWAGWRSPLYRRRHWHEVVPGELFRWRRRLDRRGLSTPA